MKNYAVLILLLITSSMVHAGNSTGLVSKIVISYKSGIMYFQLDPNTQDNVACATSKRYAVVATTDTGKAVISGILSAKAAKQIVTVTGDNQCTINADSEDVWFITIE